MSRAVGNGALDTLSKAIGSERINENAADIQGIMGVTYGDADAVHLVEKSGDDYNSPALIEIHHQISDLQAPEKTSGLMFNPEAGKLYIPCGNGITVNKATGMLEVPIGEHLRYTGRGLDVPDADETTAGVVKLTHEVSNRADGEWAITADGVYAYAPDKKTTPIVPIPAGAPISLSAPDTTVFKQYSAYGTVINKDGILYSKTMIRVRCTHDDWSKHPIVVNPALSFSAMVQFSSGLIDACVITNGAPSYPNSGPASVTFILPPYSVFALPKE